MHFTTPTWKLIKPTSGRNKRRIAKWKGFGPNWKPGYPLMQDNTNQAHGKMKRAGIYAYPKMQL